MCVFTEHRQYRFDRERDERHQGGSEPNELVGRKDGSDDRSACSCSLSVMPGTWVPGMTCLREERPEIEVEPEGARSHQFERGFGLERSRRREGDDPDPLPVGDHLGPEGLTGR